MEVVAYRHAAYDTPWWAFPSRRPGRFHRAGTQTVQYLCLHPLGPAAELLRSELGPEGDPGQLRLDQWAARLDLADPTVVGFDRCAELGIEPEALVGDDHRPTQDLADRLRVAGTRALIVPSAALPGTRNLVLFGPRVLQSYLWAPVDDTECPTGHLTAAGRPPEEVRALVRWRGRPHAGVVRWRATGTDPDLVDPPAAR